jgi:hypothetical protein
MIHPPDPDLPRQHFVRDGQRAPVTCAACGCRLEEVAAGGWFHFGRFGGRDARGCRVGCAEAQHDATGQVMVALPA